jgi:GT2 family glycosyltransferase
MALHRIFDLPRVGSQRQKEDVIALADRARDARKWSLAAELYKEVLDRDPHNPPIWVQYGHVLKEWGELRDPDKLAQAETSYRRAVALDPTLADTYLQLGHVLKLKGDIEDAKAAYLRAFAFDPVASSPVNELRGLGWTALAITELKNAALNCRSTWDKGVDTDAKTSELVDDSILDANGFTPSDKSARIGFLKDLDESFGIDSDRITSELINKRRDEAVTWYRKFGRKITVIIPSFRDASVLNNCVESIIATTSENMVEIVIVDDFSNKDDHLQFLQNIHLKYANVRLVLGNENVGFSRNVNRGLDHCKKNDIILVNSDVEMRSNNWLEILQYAVFSNDAGIGCLRLIYPSEGIQFGGGMRNFNEPIWFDHYFRKQPPNFVPAIPDIYVLYATGALMYIRRKVLNSLQGLDPEFPMAYEDVDFCLRAWEKGIRTVYTGAISALHHESATRGMEVTERESASQRYFWRKHKDFFSRTVHHGPSGRPHVIFVCQDVGVGGGHRVIYSLANYLAKNGFYVELWNLAGAPDWFELEGVSVRVFGSYYELVQALSAESAIKIATWWETADPVWLGSVITGIPVYFVQDIESSYYQGRDDVMAARVLSRYRPEFSYAVTTDWIKRTLEGRFRVHAVRIGVGYEERAFRRLDHVSRRPRTVLVAARSEPLKNFAYTKRILHELQKLDFKIIAFGPDGDSLLEGLSQIEYHYKPSDSDLCRLYNQAEFFIQTSLHEGFSLPPIEAMACGCAAILTHARGNEEYIEDLENCIVVPHDDPETAVARVLAVASNKNQISRLVAGGFRTVQRYTWEAVNARMKRFLDVIVARPEYGLQISEREVDEPI